MEDVGFVEGGAAGKGLERSVAGEDDVGAETVVCVQVP